MTTPDSPDAEGAPRFEYRAISGALLLLALTLAAAGIFISRIPRYAAFGIAALVGSFAVLVVLVRSLEKRRLTRFEKKILGSIAAVLPSDLVGSSLLAAAILGCLAATACSQSTNLEIRGWPTFSFWFGGVLAIAAFAVVSAKRAPRAIAAERISPGEIAGVAAVTLLAFLVRVVDLEEVPYPASGDETAIGLEGFRILDGQSRDMFRTGW